MRERRSLGHVLGDDGTCAVSLALGAGELPRAALRITLAKNMAEPPNA